MSVPPQGILPVPCPLSPNCHLQTQPFALPPLPGTENSGFWHPGLRLSQEAEMCWKEGPQVRSWQPHQQKSSGLQQERRAPPHHSPESTTSCCCELTAGDTRQPAGPGQEIRLQSGCVRVGRRARVCGCACGGVCRGRGIEEAGDHQEPWGDPKRPLTLFPIFASILFSPETSSSKATGSSAASGAQLRAYEQQCQAGRWGTTGSRASNTAD